MTEVLSNADFLFYGWYTTFYVSAVFGLGEWAFEKELGGIDGSDDAKTVFLAGYQYILTSVMGPLIVWFLISFLWKGIFNYGFDFVSGWNSAGVFFFNFLGIYWDDILLVVAAADFAAAFGLEASEGISAFYNQFPSFKVALAGKTILLITHLVFYYMFYDGWLEWVSWMQECPTNDCVKEVEEKEEQNAEEEDENPFALFIF